MADTLTNHLQLTKPEVGASDDTWGTKVNANLDAIDAIFAPTGGGTSVGLNVGTGKTLSVAGDMTLDGTLTLGSQSTITYEVGADSPWVWTVDVDVHGRADKVPKYGTTGAHLGLNDVPSAWHSGVPAVELFHGTDSLSGSVSGGWGSVDLTQNAYYSESVNSWVARADGICMQQHMSAAGFWWLVSPETGSGSIPTFETQMTLGLTGALFIAGALTQNSDARLKTDLRTIDGALEKISALTGYTFERTDQPDEGRQMGLIAQDVQSVAPEVVKESPGGTLAVSYPNLVALLVEGIKELQARVAQLEASR